MNYVKRCWSYLVKVWGGSACSGPKYGLPNKLISDASKCRLPTWLIVHQIPQNSLTGRGVKITMIMWDCAVFPYLIIDILIRFCHRYTNIRGRNLMFSIITSKFARVFLPIKKYFQRPQTLGLKFQNYTHLVISDLGAKLFHGDQSTELRFGDEVKRDIKV